MLADSGAATPQPTETNWHQALLPYGRPSYRKAIWQLVDTFVPYLALWALMIYLCREGHSYWISLALSLPAGALLIRIFIFFHDCCHGSFFGSRRANAILGYIAGVLTFTSFENWRFSHIAHHTTAGSLDRRGMGDIWTMTVEEYAGASTLTRLGYRLFRNPIVLFGVAPAILFLILQRFSNKNARKRERISVILTNLGIVAVILIASLTMGWRTYVMLQLPIILVAGAIGVWLFYVQHQYEGVYWARQEQWDPTKAALEGSSYYKLPRILQWFTGNIGLHHIHHLRPGIPNYNLQQCYDDIPALQVVQPLTIRRSLRCLWLKLWDEKGQALVSFRSVKALLRQA